MHEIVLEIFLRICGISAASGLLIHGDKLYIVSDNSNYLYEYVMPRQELHKHLLMDNREENEFVNKANKLDLESIFIHQDTLYLFGSGSKTNRNHLFKASEANRSSIEHTVLDNQAKYIQQQTHIDSEDFNIEGSFIVEGNYFLFNRGNGPSEKNGLVIVDTAFLHPARYVDLPLHYEGEGTPGFTDAVRVENSIYFLAAIEHEKSTYHDGKIGGSFLGKLDMNTLEVELMHKISDVNKFEGITLFSNTAEHIEFLLCEDPDNGNTESIFYKLRLKK